MSWGLVMGGNDGRPGDAPPGGWLSLYKLVVYCPGLHFPGFEDVLESSALEEGDEYCWVGGLGHLESTHGGFLTGGEVQESLGLALRFAKDEICISRICYHRDAILAGGEEDPPPLYACRGIVKNFESSELGIASGAAAYLRESNAGGGCAEHGREEPPCIFCGALLWALPEKCFPESYPHGYDEMFRENYAGEDEDYDSDPEPRRMMATGSICCNGHLLLGIAGAEPSLAGRVVSNSGEDLQLAQCDTVRYFTECLEGMPELGYADGQHFVDSLQLDQLVITGARLDKLCGAWPCQESDGCARYRVFSQNSWRCKDARKGAMSALDLLKSGLPGDVQDKFHGYILSGYPSLTTCVASLSEALEEHKRNEERLERRQEIMDALGRAGYQRYCISDSEPVNQYVKVG